MPLVASFTWKSRPWNVPTPPASRLIEASTTYPSATTFVALVSRLAWKASSPVPNEVTLLKLIRIWVSSKRYEPFLTLPAST